MIVKKIPNPKKSALKNQRVYSLLAYILNRGVEGQEKCVYAWARNFLTDSDDGHAVEMLALANQAVRSADPIDHYILSFAEGENPSPSQVDEMIQILADHLDVSDHQMVYATHADTKNTHIHVVLNRIDPVTEKPKKIDFIVNALHEAVAKIESKQGWKSEPAALFTVLADGSVARRASGERSEKAKKVGSVASKFEQLTGQESIQSKAVDVVWPLIKEAKGWSDLHRQLESVGFNFKRTGSGAVVEFQGIQIKASSVHRSASLKNLEKRFGPYQTSERDNNGYIKHEPIDEQNIGGFPTEGAGPNGLRNLSKCGLARAEQQVGQGILPGHARTTGHAFACMRRPPKRVAHQRRTESTCAPNRASDAGGAMVKKAAELYATERIEHQQIVKQVKRNLAADFEMQRQQLESQLKAKAVLPDSVAAELQNLTASQKKKEKEIMDRVSKFPAFVKWLGGVGNGALADVWRYRWAAFRYISGDEILKEDGDSGDFEILQTEGYQSRRIGSVVHYFKEGQAIPSIVDHGNKFEIVDTTDDEAIGFALQMCHQRNGKVHIHSCDPLFIEKAVRIARRLNIPISNPELRKSGVRAELDEVVRQALAKRIQKMPVAREIDQFDGALRADRYTVMASKRTKDGKVLQRMLTHESGASVARLRSEVMAEMLKAEQRGERLSITPLCAAATFITLPRLTSLECSRLQLEGFMPALVTKSGEDKYDVILKVARPMSMALYGTVREHILQRIGRAGGKVQSNAVSAPGFVLDDSDRKSNLGELRCLIQYAKHVICKHSGAAAELLEGRMRKAPSAPSQVPNSGALFDRHVADIEVVRLKQRDVSPFQQSKMDWMVLMRLRVTGHSAQEVEAEFRNAVSRRQKDASTERYVKRTIDAVFGPRGNDEVWKLERFREDWQSVEAMPTVRSGQSPRILDAPHGLPSIVQANRLGTANVDPSSPSQKPR